MGTLNHFNVAGIAKLHGLVSFVETGTAQGDGLAWAATAPFKALHSIEIDAEVAARANARFGNDDRISIWTGDSRSVLVEILKVLPDGPCLFWLDAHFPGAHTGADYNAEPDAGRRLPLVDEIALLARERHGQRDVIMIDDARIYQPGLYGAGNLPEDWPPLQGVTRSLYFIRQAFGKTHGVVVDYADQGYVMVYPNQDLQKAA